MRSNDCTHPPGKPGDAYWTLALPGRPYAGDDPEGHVSRDEIVAYLEAYAAGAGEIREGVRVDALGPC